MTDRFVVSSAEAAGEAVTHTREVLFPFNLERFIVLGFVAFLEQCGRRSGLSVPNPNINSGNWHTSSRQAAHWVTGHVAIILAIAFGIFLVSLAIGALVLWINSRAVMVYIDNVATGEARLVAPWREHAQLAGSLFRFRLVLAVAGGLLVFSSLVAILIWASFLYSSSSAPTGALVGVGLLVGLFLILALVLGLLDLALHDFVAPLQLHQQIECLPALGLLLGLFKSYPFSFLGYLALKIFFSIVIGIIEALVSCCTCCIGALPIVSQTLLQPLHFFVRAWPLCLLRQMGYDLLTPEESVA